MTNNQLTTERLEIMLAETLGTTAERGDHASIEVTASIFVSILSEVLESRRAGTESLAVRELFKRAKQLMYQSGGAPIENSLNPIDAFLFDAEQVELQERRKADSEPVAWTDTEELRDVNVAGIGYLFGIDREANKFADPRRQIMLYRHAQPAPVVTFYRDGIEDAAKWTDQQRELYDNEHGWSDPDTGAFEFASDVQRGYSSTLEELAEGIRALHPNAGNSPVIPDRWITVSERLPNKNQSVLILVDFDSSFVEPLICTARFTGSTFRRGDATIKPGSGVEKVTYWMPLPAAPKQENI